LAGYGGVIGKVVMVSSRKISRRTFLTSISLTPAATSGLEFPIGLSFRRKRPLEEFGYGDVTLRSELHQKQLDETHAVLMELSEDSLLKPFRQMAGQSSPGVDLGGWYHYDPDYDPDTVTVGFAPGASFGRWFPRSPETTRSPVTLLREQRF
jgi:uncharacterized protein